MLQRHYVAVVLAFAAVPCACLGFTGVATPSIDPESYAVYSAVVPRVWMIQIAHAERYAILDQTSSVHLKMTPSGESEEKMLGAMQSYELLNRHEWQLQRHFALDLPYDLISAIDFNAEIERARQQHEEWDLSSLYPGTRGTIRLSAVGFNNAKTVAVVQMQWSCGTLCGGAEMYVLEKMDGNWAPMLWDGLVESRRH